MNIQLDEVLTPCDSRRDHLDTTVVTLSSGHSNFCRFYRDKREQKMRLQKNIKIFVYTYDIFGLSSIQCLLTMTDHRLNSIPGLSILLITETPVILTIHRLKLIQQHNCSKNHLNKCLNPSSLLQELSCLPF